MKAPRSTTQKRPGLLQACKRLLTFLPLTAVLFFNPALLRASDTAVGLEDDATITVHVKRSLLLHLFLNTRTETSAGVVTLSGNAANADEKDLNTRLATGIIGVKSVINHMIIPVIRTGNN